MWTSPPISSVLVLSPESERYHTGQYAKPYESTGAFADMIRSVTGYPTLNGRVLDVGCGAGANIHWLDEWGVTKGCDVAGVDIDAGLLKLAEVHNPARAFMCRSFLDPLPPCTTALSIQVLSFIEDWRPAMRELLASAKEWVFVSSLFWDGVGTHTHATDGDKVNAHYNVIDTSVFENLCTKFGGASVTWRMFNTVAKLKAPIDQLRSRTSKGRTFSGPLHLPWRFAAVRKG
jgi:SAM-dependent methyltransferase